MRIDYNIKDKFDFGLFLPALILFGFGLLAIYSSTVNNSFAQENFQRQLVWGAFAFIVFFITYSLPTNIFKSFAIPGYLISLLLLLAVLAIGRQISG
ncbi:MAG: FtsW/RodA/SpoVE family cell cycle protein, partial [Ignavibacteriaceae bacterium]|nr:FtsW/RodA/SpoVE family cell cycle protein [Ignavibacteriaceae bacterium]